MTDSPADLARFDAAMKTLLEKCDPGEKGWVENAIAEVRGTHGLDAAIEHATAMAEWEPEPPSPPVVCDACGTSFPTFCPGQAYGCDSGLTSDRTGFGGAYGSKHDCCYYTVADPASFPGNDVCDVCIDAMLADGRLVDGRHVNLATGEETPIEDDDDGWVVEFLDVEEEPGDEAAVLRAILAMPADERDEDVMATVRAWGDQQRQTHQRT